MLLGALINAMKKTDRRPQHCSAIILGAGAAIAADGRTINNALAYPGLFRVALDAKAKDITFEMQLAAAKELARLTPDENLLPNMLDRKVHRKIAQAVARAWC